MYTKALRQTALLMSGLITALTAGTATITARSASGKKAKVKVKVVDPYAPDSVALNYTGTLTLKVGQTLQLGAAVLPDTARTTLRWTTSRKRVAAVSADGLVTALRRGTATITVKTANGKKARVKVRVVTAVVAAGVLLQAQRHSISASRTDRVSFFMISLLFFCWGFP